VNGIQDPEVSNETNQTILKQNLSKKKKILEDSKLYQNVITSLTPHKFSKIRCVALGSPSQEAPALYQLALLQLICENFEIKAQDVSLFDPVFTSLDNDFFTSLQYEINDEYLPNDTDDVLFFLPHAPLSLTDKVICSQRPKLLLANNLQTHTDRLTKLELFEKYPLISKLVSLLGNKNDSDADGFEHVVKKKNRRQKNKFAEPIIDHSKTESYFENIELKSYKEFEEGEWLNSFTDLAFHKIT